MTEQSSFKLKFTESVPAEKRGILDELNLPPQVISFIRKNARLVFDTRNVYKKDYPNVIRL